MFCSPSSHRSSAPMGCKHISAVSFKNRRYSDSARMKAINGFDSRISGPFHNDLAISNLVQQLRTESRKGKATA
jgi:hypothetical protein